MPRYVPKVVPVEAFLLDGGRGYVVIPPGEDPRIVALEDFERVFELDEPPPREHPGVTHTPADEIPAAERMAAAIAARTEPGGPGATRLPRTKEEIARAIAETRDQVDREAAQRAAADGQNPLSDGKVPIGAKLKPGEKPGRGRKVCVREGCMTVNALPATKCIGCGKPVKVIER